MKPHLRITEDRDGGPGFPRKPVSQKMIDGPADFFIIRDSGDAGDASVCVEPHSCILFEGTGADLSVLPLCFHLQDQRSRR